MLILYIYIYPLIFTFCRQSWNRDSAFNMNIPIALKSSPAVPAKHHLKPVFYFTLITFMRLLSYEDAYCPSGSQSVKFPFLKKALPGTSSTNVELFGS